MSELVLAPELTTPDVIGTGAAVEGSAPVLITEQQVMFATATAAVVPPTPHTAGRRWWMAISRLFATTKDAGASEDDRRAPRYVPRRYTYLEDAAMARAMYRL